MTDAEQLLAQALQRVTFCPGTGTKRFARDMAALAQHRPEHELTPKQRRYLLTATVRFRRQLPPSLVQLARDQLAADEAIQT